MSCMQNCINYIVRVSIRNVTRLNINIKHTDKNSILLENKSNLIQESTSKFNKQWILHVNKCSAKNNNYSVISTSMHRQLSPEKAARICCRQTTAQRCRILQMLTVMLPLVAPRHCCLCL